MKSPQPSQFHRRLGAYSTLAAAGACAATTAPTGANTTIVYSGPINSNVPATVTGEFINLTTFQVGNTYAAINGGSSTAPALNLWGTSASRAWLYPTSSGVNRFVSGAGDAALELIAGALINAASTYGSTATPSPGLTGAGGAWVGGTTGYLGFKFLSGGLTL